MASLTVGENQLQRIIRDLHDAVAELIKEHQESGEPITDDSSSLHKFSYKLEYLLQFDQKEKSSFLGTRKDYWDYFCECLTKIKGTNDGIRFVKSISELKTSLGRGRAFIRYCLVHQRLADTLQQCLMNQRVTSEWYYARSPFLKPHLNVDLINHLYELNQVQFDVASRGYDLDTDWPTFARRTVGSGGSAALGWRTPSRCSSVSSLISAISQQTYDAHTEADLEPAGEASCSEVDELRLQRDQAELQKRQLMEQVDRLKLEVKELQEKLVVAEGRNRSEGQQALKKTSEQNLVEKTKPEQNENMEIRPDETQSKKDEQNRAELETLEARADMENWRKQVDKLTQELKTKENRLKEIEEKISNLSKEQRTSVEQQTKELQTEVQHLQQTLSLKEKEVENLQNQLQELQTSLTARDHQLDEARKKAQVEYSDLQQKTDGLEEKLRAQISLLQDQLQESEHEKLGQYQLQCASLMEINAKLVRTLEKAEERSMELIKTKATLEEELVMLKAAEKKHTKWLNSAGEENQKFLKDDLTLERIQSAHGKADSSELELKPLELETPRLHAPLGDVQDKGYRKDFPTKEADSQLELNMKEITRLQKEVVDLRAQLQVSAEERMKLLALQEVTKARCEELSQTKHLKSPELNLVQIQELLPCQERETLTSEAQARATLQAEISILKEELDGYKRQNNILALENEETREALHRAHTETAKLGVQVCALTGENEDHQRRNEELASRLRNLEEAQREVQNRSDAVETPTKETSHLLAEAVGVANATQELKQRFQEAKEEAMCLRKSHHKEINGLRLQLSEATRNHQNQIKALNDQLLATRAQMEAEQDKVSTLESRLVEMQTLHSSYSKEVEESHCRSDLLIGQKDKQLEQLHQDLTKAQEELLLNQKTCQELGENLQKTEEQMEMERLKASAEIDDLYRTKKNLEERLIELIREKDVLWKKSDALEQKLEEEQEREGPNCPDCHSPFSWWLRRHVCRLCGRSFCYYCCSNTLISPARGSRERCCKECFSRHSGAERHLQDHMENPARSSYSPLTSTPTRGNTPGVTVAAQTLRPDDAAFDIITDEELHCINHSNSLPFTTALTPESTLPIPSSLSSSLSGGDLTADEEEQLPSAHDTELHLLTSPDITCSVPVNLEEMIGSGVRSGELFIRSGSCSRLVLTAVTMTPLIRWEFSSSPKSISFCVVYRESTDAPPTHAKVLIPLNRCNAHRERVQGEVRGQHPGEYTLIFDNSYSRFTSKSVLYALSVDPSPPLTTADL